MSWAAGGEAGTALPARALTLLECVEIALEESPRVSGAEQNVAGAEASVRRSYSSYLPQATITMQHGRSGGVSFLDTPAGLVPLSTTALGLSRRTCVSPALSWVPWLAISPEEPYAPLQPCRPASPKSW